MEAVIELLRNLASLEGEFYLTERPADGGGTQFKVRPAITTFSDHIVMSYPIEHMRKLGREDDLDMGLLMAQRLIGTLAAAAMSLGLLIRGATIGQLYHSGGVVVGEAMNEAYCLESRVSIYRE